MLAGFYCVPKAIFLHLYFSALDYAWSADLETVRQSEMLTQNIFWGFLPPCFCLHNFTRAESLSVFYDCSVVFCCFLLSFGCWIFKFHRFLAIPFFFFFCTLVLFWLHFVATFLFGCFCCPLLLLVTAVNAQPPFFFAFFVIVLRGHNLQCASHIHRLLYG